MPKRKRNRAAAAESLLDYEQRVVRSAAAEVDELDAGAFATDELPKQDIIIYICQHLQLQVKRMAGDKAREWRSGKARVPWQEKVGKGKPARQGQGGLARKGRQGRGRAGR
jgi:hypothetical protein